VKSVVVKKEFGSSREIRGRQKEESGSIGEIRGRQKRRSVRSAKSVVVKKSNRFYPSHPWSRGIGIRHIRGREESGSVKSVVVKNRDPSNPWSKKL
jgi:hypothetical protein